jgi:hypothetical protein
VTFVMKRRTFVFALVFVALVATLEHSAVARPATGQAPTSANATISPNCSLYAVTLTVRVLLQDFNSPKLLINAKKWPRLMAEAKAARAAFTDPRLAPVRPRYDDLVRRLAVVGTRLARGDRAAAYAALKAGKPDLQAVLAAAKRGNVVCKSGSTVIPIG